MNNVDLGLVDRNLDLIGTDHTRLCSSALMSLAGEILSILRALLEDR